MLRSMRTYSPRRAWLLAIGYSGACWLVATLVGTTARVFDDPPATSEQLHDWRWWISVGIAVATIGVAYGVVWSSDTLVFDRQRHLGSQVLFGVIWGSGSGLWLATLFVLSDRTGWAPWAVWLLTFGLISLWQALWHNLCWDVYVAPEHDTPESIRRKLPRTHLPNILVTLSFLVAYENFAMFVLLQTTALVISAVAMRFPPWWEKHPVLAATTEPGLFGLPHATGFEGSDAEAARGAPAG